jgi:acrylyl-CoA reductase (NADPH)
VAITLLAARGFSVVASTGRMQEAAFLQSLGATSAIDRSELSSAGKPLQKERWAGVVDSVGSHTLVNALAQCRYGAVVAACGLAQGMDMPGSVAPFILRGVTLAGIDSVNAPQLRRRNAWELLATTLDRARLDTITTEIGLSQTIEQAAQILAGRVRGRTVVDVRP